MLAKFWGSGMATLLALVVPAAVIGLVGDFWFQIALVTAGPVVAGFVGRWFWSESTKASRDG